jgi:glyoxylate carboligase
VAASQQRLQAPASHKPPPPHALSPPPPQGAKKPVIYLGGGCLDASEEVREFVAHTRIPVASTLMGLGVYPSDDPLSLNMLGMHGTVYANYAVDQADLLVAMGVRWAAGRGAARAIECGRASRCTVHQGSVPGMRPRWPSRRRPPRAGGP